MSVSRVERRTATPRAPRLAGSRAGVDVVRDWQGIANVPLPGGPGTGPDHMTVYVQMPDTLALNVNSRVRVADVFVGRVRAIELKNWVATLTLDLEPDVKLPKNTLAKIGQTSLLGSQHVQLDPPPDPSPELLRDGDTIPLKNASAFPTTERVLASIAHHPDRRRHPEPGGDPDRDQQHPDRPRPIRSASSWAGSTPSPPS